MKPSSPNQFIKIVLAMFMLTAVCSKTLAQPTTFMKLYNNGNSGYTVREINGNSYVSAGGTDFYFNWHWHTMSSIPTTGVHLFKTDNNGALIWEKIYNRINARIIARWFEPTQDGGYILTGFTNSDVVWPPDSNNIILIKTDANGAITWSKSYDTGKDELGYCVRQTADGGYIVSGFYDAVPVTLAGTTYSVLIKTDANGTIQWEKKYQIACRDLGTSEPFPYVVRQTADGGYVVVGTTVASHAADLCVFRTDGLGNLTWAKSYDHDSTALRFSVGLDIIESASGDFVIAGALDKDRAAMKYNYPYILKISSTGTLITAKFFETNPLLFFQSGFSSVEQTPDGGFFFAGMGGYSDFGDQAQMLKTDVNFNVVWSRIYSADGVANMGSRSGIFTTDGGYIFTGKHQMDGTVLLKTNGVGLINCKNPGVLVELIPGITFQNRNPAITSGINTNNIVLTTVSPLADTSITCPLNFTLPVELTYFTAVPVSEKQVQLNWITASEINNDYFIIEKSMDGIQFKETAMIKGGGSSTTLLNYTFTDEFFPGNHILYYRLKQVDYNGAVNYSQIVPVAFNDKSFKWMKTIVDYNDKAINIFISNNSSQLLRYKLTDVYGRTITSSSQILPNGSSSFSINCTYLAHGTYFVLLNNGNNFLKDTIFY
jgi:hypothetical protein